jgi:hypothetical protein
VSDRPPALCEDCRYSRFGVGGRECAAKGHRLCDLANPAGQCETFCAREGVRGRWVLAAGIGIGAAVTTLLTLILGG